MSPIEIQSILALPHSLNLDINRGKDQGLQMPLETE